MDNIEIIAAYFAAGCKDNQLIGVELEHFIVDKQTKVSLQYSGGVEEILRRLQPLYGEAVYSQGRIIGINRNMAHITIEPAAQIEISMGPVETIAELQDIYNNFIYLITPILDDFNCELLCYGYQPKSKISELEMIPKKRYEYMAAHFAKTGTMGLNMMKGTAAAQISIDYKNEEDFAKKFRLANILGPVLSLICSNTSVFEGEIFERHLLRTEIWQNVDNIRSGVVPGALEQGFGFKDYAEFIYNLPAVLYLENGEVLPAGDKTFAEIYQNKQMTTADAEHAITMAFPDVALKNHIEIRMCDSMPIDETLELAKIIRKIFYDNLSYFTELTKNVTEADINEAKNSLVKYGKNCEIYGQAVGFWMDKIKGVNIC